MATQLETLCNKLGIRASAVYGKTKENPNDEWHRTAHPYRVTLYHERRQLSVDFWMGPAHTKEPSAADVLACLVSDSSVDGQSFEDFCGDFGYDVDSRKAEATYKACVKLAPRVRRFLGEHFDAVAQAEH